MDQKEIDFIQKRWAGTPIEPDIQKLIDEIARLRGIIDGQTDIIEDRILDKMADESRGE